ncbi:MAG: hypothetical protein M3441_25870, partial [Chloroflexota bacterium]|nr:hypothetical protein [Chloroflexota bacterium]
MPGTKDTETDRAEIKADLALHLCEGLLRELIVRGTITEAALARILDHSGETVPSLFKSEELRRDYDALRARLEGSV